MKKKKLSFKKNFKRLSKKDKIYLLIFLGAISLLIIVALIFLWEPISRVLHKNFGAYDRHILLQYFLISFFVTYLLSFAFFLILAFFTGQLNLWVLLTTSLCIFVFVFGFFLIDLYFGNPSLSLFLRGPENSIQGVINCKNYQAEMVAGNPVECTLNYYKDIQNSTIFVSFLYSDNTRQEFFEIGERDYGSFVAPKDIERIYFKVEGHDHSGETSSLSTGADYKFSSEEDFQRRKEKFLLYILGLFAVVFISIPASIVNIKKLLKD